MTAVPPPIDPSRILFVLEKIPLKLAGIAVFAQIFEINIGRGRGNEYCGSFCCGTPGKLVTGIGEV